MSSDLAASTTRLLSPSPSPRPSAILSLVAYPTRALRSDRLLTWKQHESSHDVDDLFLLFDSDCRLEVLKSGVYRVKIYLESVDHDFSSYHLEINGFAVSSFAAVMFGGATEKSSSATGIVIDRAMFQEALLMQQMNVADVRLSKWDMLVVRRKPNVLRMYGGRSPFGRLVLEPIRLDAL